MFLVLAAYLGGVTGLGRSCDDRRRSRTWRQVLNEKVDWR
jgi:hypothetical protein